jgi:hypothetical protein
MDIIKGIMCGLFGCQQAQPDTIPAFPVRDRRQITAAEIITVLSQKFPTAMIDPSDMVQSACDIEDINTFLEQDQTNRIKYVTEKFDCDNFSFRLKGQFSIPGWATLSIGLVRTDLHMLSGFLDNNLQWWFIEPQTDGLSDKLATWQGSRVLYIII